MRGSLFYDPVISYSGLQQSIPAAQMVNYWDVTFNLNDTYMKYLNDKADSCGFTDFINTAMTFPPAGPLPDPPKHHVDHCEIWKSVIPAAFAVNPCWDIYDLTTTCKNPAQYLHVPRSVLTKLS
jgi:carboxypeptidase D